MGQYCRDVISVIESVSYVRRDWPIVGRKTDRLKRSIGEPKRVIAMIVLRVKKQPSVPLEAESISPDVTAKRTLDDVRALPVYLGKRECRLDEFFEVDGAAGDEIEMQGDAGRVKWVGRGMSRGRIRVVGNAGMHLGAYMKGGVIEVSGNASDWVGAEMTDGLIRITGNAGGQIGAAYRGSLAGMKGGT